MSSHDPLCPIVDKAGWPFGGSCLCDLIRQAEQRGLNKSWEVYDGAIADEHYARGQRDMLARCVAAVEGGDCECIDGADFGEHFSGIRLCGRCVALAALRGLGGDHAD